MSQREQRAMIKTNNDESHEVVEPEIVRAEEIAPPLPAWLRCTWSLFGMNRHFKAKRPFEPDMR